MDNKKKPQTTLKEIRKKMKKLTLAENKQVKEEKQQQKQKEKEYKQKQKITQRVKININIPSQKTSTPQIQNPLSTSNRDQINLLTSINEQLKQKNEPVARAPQNFNISQPNLNKDYADINNRQQDFENELQGLPLQFSEKIAPTPVITPNKIPIVNKPKELSGLSLFEQLDQKAEEQIRRTNEQVKQMEEKNKEEKRQQAKEKKERKLMEDEENYQKQQDKNQMKEEEERNKLLESRRKANEKDNKQQQISNKAFNILLQKSDVEDIKNLQEAYDRGFLTDNAIKEKLKKLKYTRAEIKRIFSNPK